MKTETHLTPAITEDRRIRAGDRYFNEVHRKQMPVPAFWVGTLPEEHSDPIYRTRDTISR